MKNLSSIDLQSLIRPTEPIHILAMLKEVSHEIDNITAHFDAVITECEVATTFA